MYEEHNENESYCEEIDCLYAVCSKRTDGNTTKHSFDVSSAHEVIQILNHFKFGIYASNCEDDHSFDTFSTKLENETIFCCENLTCGFIHDFHDYFYTNLNACTPENTKLKPTLIENSVPLVVFGFLSLLGNCIVICKSVMALKKSSIPHKEMQIYNVLVLNLATADFLMGIYLVVAGIEIQHKIQENIFFSEIGLCNALGIINFVSSEVSLTLLVIISFFRLHSVKYPYENQRSRTALVLVIMTWVVWIIIAFIPILNFEPFVSYFTLGIRFKKTHINDNSILIKRVRELLNETFTKSYETSQLHQILKAIMKYPTIDVLIKTLDQFGLSHYEPSWSTMGFYSSQYMCSTNYIIRSDFSTGLPYFTLSIVTYNLLCSVSVVFAYSIIFNTLFQCQKKRNVSRGKRMRSIKLSISQKPHNCRRNAENSRMFQLIAIVVATDIACWIPLCLTSLVLYGLFDSNSDCYYVIAYNGVQLFMSCAVVVNSIVNPYIYSFHFWKSLFVRFKKRAFHRNAAN